MWAPIGPWEGVSWVSVFNNPEISGLPFIRVPEDLLSQWVEALPGRVHAEETRDLWDYLYAVSELVDLSGNKFHRKKNLLSQFMKKYPFKYDDITPALIHTVLAMQEEWCVWRDCESTEMLAAESRCIKRVLETWGDLSGIKGAIISVNDRPAAFTVAEVFREDSLIIHFEKGLPEYTGIYQAVNQMFLEHNSAYSYVNREQDLGDEGLRNGQAFLQPHRLCQEVPGEDHLKHVRSTQRHTRFSIIAVVFLCTLLAWLPGLLQAGQKPEDPGFPH